MEMYARLGMVSSELLERRPRVAVPFCGFGACTGDADKTIADEWMDVGESII